MINLLRNIDKYIIGVVLFLFVPIKWFSKKSILKYNKNSNNYKKNNKNTVSNTDIKEILFVKLWAIGDSVNTLPLIQEIKRNNPNTKITVLAKNNNFRVYQNLDFIDEIILFEPKNIFKIIFMFRKYDISFDLEPYLNSSAIISRYTAKFTVGLDKQHRSVLYDYKIEFSKEKHIVLTYMNMGTFLGVKDIPKKLVNLNYLREEEQHVNKLLTIKKISKNDKLIGICASVGLMIKEREWPKNNFRELANELAKRRNTKIILIGTRDDMELNEFIKNNNNKIVNLSGEISIGELFCLIKKMDIFISNDTGPMHISAAQGVKTIGLFGPNTPKIWAPYGINNISIFHPKKGCPYIDNTNHDLAPKKLTEEQKSCMDVIKVSEVLNKIKIKK